MMDLFLPKTLTDGVVWIIVMIYQLFGLSFWRHPFTTEHPCDAAFLQIWWRHKLIHVFDGLKDSQQMLTFGWTSFETLVYCTLLHKHLFFKCDALGIGPYVTVQSDQNSSSSKSFSVSVGSMMFKHWSANSTNSGSCMASFMALALSSAESTDITNRRRWGFLNRPFNASDPPEWMKTSVTALTALQVVWTYHFIPSCRSLCKGTLSVWLSSPRRSSTDHGCSAEINTCTSSSRDRVLL